MKAYILIIKRGEDSGRIVQWATSIEHAQQLIADIMPPLLPGYYYTIITK